MTVLDRLGCRYKSTGKYRKLLTKKKTKPRRRKGGNIEEERLMLFAIHCSSHFVYIKSKGRKSRKCPLTESAPSTKPNMKGTSMEDEDRKRHRTCQCKNHWQCLGEPSSHVIEAEAVIWVAEKRTRRCNE